jgi:prepilin-type N-terminal cleavage/methylation domain-containing protein/prepilin-type processing-associated H-X9-DG protein
MNTCEIRAKRQGLRGFTLIELLVVIAIIAVLMGILMPALRAVKEQARATVCRSNLKNVGLAVIMYLDDFERRLPFTGQSNRHLWKTNTGDWRTPGSSDTYWGIFYRRYIDDNTKIFGCPSLQRVAGNLIYDYTNAGFPDPGDVIQHAAYGLNHHQKVRGTLKKPFNTNSVYRADEFMVCVDHAEPRTEGVNDALHNVPSGTNLAQYRPGGNRHAQYRQIYRHNTRSEAPDETRGEANMLFLDGHVIRLRESNGADVPLRWYTGEKNATP